MWKAWSVFVISVAHLTRTLQTKKWVTLVKFTGRVKQECNTTHGRVGHPGKI